MLLFLELYLEEIADRVIEVDMECQTDAFLDRPPTPLFIPARTNKDVATEILEGEVSALLWLPIILVNEVKLSLGKAKYSQEPVHNQKD